MIIHITIHYCTKISTVQSTAHNFPNVFTNDKPFISHYKIYNLLLKKIF